MTPEGDQECWGLCPRSRPQPTPAPAELGRRRAMQLATAPLRAQLTLRLEGLAGTQVSSWLWVLGTPR